VTADGVGRVDCDLVMRRCVVYLLRVESMIFVISRMYSGPCGVVDGDGDGGVAIWNPYRDPETAKENVQASTNVFAYADHEM